MIPTTYFPLFKDFKRLAKQGNILPVYAEILADRDTPVSIYEKLSRINDHAFLLESVEGGERWGRYSFIASQPASVMHLFTHTVIEYCPGKIIRQHKTSQPLDVIKKILHQFKPVHVPGLPRFWGGVVGYISYDMIRTIERIPQRHAALENMPDGIFMLSDHLVIFDHVSHKVKIVACVNINENASVAQSYRRAQGTIIGLLKAIRTPLPTPVVHKPKKRSLLSSHFQKKSFCKAVNQAKKYIASGDIIQVVLSERFSRRIDAEPFDVYRALRVINPSPYMFFLKMGSLHLVGSSPEILVRKEGRNVEIRPIAGTRKRGSTPEKDIRLERELLHDPKELAEHTMLVDLARNDLGRVCTYKSIKLPEIKGIERYSHVMHIVSSVVGELKNRLDAVDVLKACFPAGTVTGAPKIRAMEIIDELEHVARGPYAGAVGYFSFSGNMDMAITIRTIVIQNRTAWIQAGAGIVADSVPRYEYKEIKNKAAALCAAVRIAEEGLQ